MGNAVKKTMLLVLLDESGSMSGLKSDVIKGINNFIEEQRKLPDPAVLAIANFGGHIPGMINFIRPMTDLREVRLLTDMDYVPTGGTPLLDATGRSIQTLDADWAREKPDRCVFVTFTDGEENASTEFSVGKIKSLIEAREKSGLWSFLFLGANIDSFTAGGAMGYTRSKMSNYTANSAGLAGATYTMGQTVGNLRSMDAGNFASASAGNLDIGLGGDIQEDGSVTNKIGSQLGSQQGLGSGGTGLGSSTIPSATPPAAAMKQESWEPPASSALFDPKVDAWKPPV